MTTTASKLFLGGAVAALLSAWIYGWGTGGGLTGVMLFGLLGGVGELTGYTILVAAAAVLAALGTTTSVLRDADPETQAAAARLEVATPQGALVYAVTGAHLALTGAGLLFAALMAFRTLGGQYSAKDREGVVAATVFWWAVALTYGVLWYAIYVTK